MKSLLRFCLFVIACLVWLGSSVNIIHAQNQVASAHTPGTAVAEGNELLKQNKYTEALLIFKKAASQGDSEAMRLLGNIYSGGEGVARDYASSLAWYKKSAAAGNAVAMLSMARQYETGCALSQDIDAAIDWYRRAGTAASAQGKQDLQDLTNNLIAMDEQFKADPVELQRLRCPDAADDAIRKQQAAHTSLVHPMGADATILALRHNLNDSAADKLVSLELAGQVLKIVQQIGAEAAPVILVKEVPLVALNAGDIEAQSSSSGGALSNSM